MVLAQSRYKHDLELMINEVQNRAFNSYVLEYVDYPRISLLHFHLTYLFLSSRGMAEKKKKNITTSQLYIQLGLDTHDNVPIVVHQPQENMTERQLTVLSGDYFSSFYYLFLAENQEIELIQSWAKVIQDINEQKMDIHEKRDRLSDLDYFIRICQVKARLTKAVLTWYDAEKSWFLLADLLTQLVEGKAQSQSNQQQFDHIYTHAEQLVARHESQLVREECKLWLDQIRAEQLVIEP